MRVALLTESYLPVVNGVSTSVETLGHELTLLGHQPVVVAPKYPGYRDAQGLFPVRRLPSWRTPLNPNNPFAFPPIVRLPRVLRNLPVDIVHTHHPFGIGKQGEKLATRLQVPLVTTFHTLYMEYGHYVPFLPRPLVNWEISHYLAHYYNGCDMVIVPSTEAGRRLIEIGVDSERLHCIPTGVPDAVTVTSEEVAQARKHYELPEGVPILLYVGRLAKEKNLDLLLEAFLRLRQMSGSAENAILLLVGDGPYHEECIQWTKHHSLEAVVRFTGVLPHPSLAPLYTLATLFAFPSSSETQGIVLCEAQSHGLPCVVVEGGGAPEFVRNGVDALIVAPEPEIFADALNALIVDDVKRAEFSVAARVTPLRLTPQRMVQSIAGLYCQLIEQRKELPAPGPFPSQEEGRGREDDIL